MDPCLPAPAPPRARGAEACLGALFRRPPRRGASVPSPRWCRCVPARALSGRVAAFDSCRDGQPASASRRSCRGAYAILERRRSTTFFEDAVRRGRFSNPLLARVATAGGIFCWALGTWVAHSGSRPGKIPPRVARGLPAAICSAPRDRGGRKTAAAAAPSVSPSSPPCRPGFPAVPTRPPA